MERKKEIEKLLEDLKKYNWGRKEIEAEFKYNANYISQALSRGGNDKLLNNLRKLHERVVGGMREYNIGIAVKKIQAGMDVTLLAVAELLAKANNQPIAVVVDQLEGLVRKRINDAELDK